MSNNGWIEIIDNGYAQISVKINNKVIPLRFTVSQQERLIELQGRQKEEAEKEQNQDKDVITSFLTKRTNDDIECCLIALNPMPDKTEYTREFIEENLDVDQIRLLTQIWMSRKVLNPSVTSLKKEIELNELSMKANVNSSK